MCKEIAKPYYKKKKQFTSTTQIKEVTSHRKPSK